MPYPLPGRRKHLFSGVAMLLLAFGAKAAMIRENYCGSDPVFPHISPGYTLYGKDTSLEHRRSGIIRTERNGDVVISIPPGSTARYKVRFFGRNNALLFEVREIRDSPLIVEKVNFVHAGIFQYEIYRDNYLIEKNSFRISP